MEARFREHVELDAAGIKASERQIAIFLRSWVTLID